MIRIQIRFLLSALLLLLASCTVGKPLPNTSEPLYSVPAGDDLALEGMYWWAYRYRITWPEGSEKPDFSIDLLIADTIVKPVLKKYTSQLPWWRFHRRAARTPPGHQFSFLFYSSRETAVKIIKALNDSPQLAAVKQAGLIKKIVTSKTDDLKNGGIEDFSDPSWSPEIQRTWPTFIMGVSAFWLALIEDIHATQSSSNNQLSVTDQLEEYRSVDEKIAELWEKEGQHSLLHHLNAVFGYKSMQIRW